MNPRSTLQRTTRYHTTLKQLIQNDSLSPHLDKRISLSKWSRSLSTLIGYLPARRPSREGITESDHADTMWHLFMCHIPETLELLRGIWERDLHIPSLAFEEALERVQFHTVATELLTCYYRRYVISNALHVAWLMFAQKSESAKCQPSNLCDTSLGRKYAEVCTC